MTQLTDQMTNTNNTKPIIKPDQLAILQELSKLLDVSFKEVRSFDELKYYYSNSSIPYNTSLDGDVIGLSTYNTNITAVEMNLICQLKNLTHLYLNRNKIQNINPISNLNSLISLSLNSNQIHDISRLSGLKNLNYLNLSYNQIQDICQDPNTLDKNSCLKILNLKSIP
jgi:Leucine-rich repeat (LRR) protein